MIKYIEAHEARYHWKIMKKSEVNNNNTTEDGKLKNIFFIWYFKRNILPDEILTKHKDRLCVHGGMK